MRRLSDVVDEEAASSLRALLDAGRFPGISFENAMEFLLSDGILPASGLPVMSFLEIEDWARQRLRERDAGSYRG